MQILDSDDPTVEVADDKYGFSSTVVPRLVKLAAQWPSQSGTVIGLVGAWGSGKTSVLHMATEGIREAVGPDAIVSFSPWSYDDPASLTLAFFGSIRKHLSKSEDGRLKALASSFGKIGTGLGVAASGLQLCGVSFDPEAARQAVDIVKGTSDLIESFGRAEVDMAKGFADARDSLTDLVKDRGRLIVFIDDIDRLSYPEIKALLRLMRIVTDLPGVSLVVAMDEARVRDMLRVGAGTEFGSKYLEKIIQARVHVPTPAPNLLLDALVARLREVFAEAGLDYPEELNPTGFSAPPPLLLIQRLLTSPRDVVRFGNSFAILLLETSGKHLDPVDAAVLSALDTIVPEAYETIQSDRQFFLGTDSGLRWHRNRQALRDERTEHYKDLVEANIPIEQRGIFRESVELLFGDVEKPASERGAVSSPGKRRGRRLRDPNHFDTYFLAASPMQLTEPQTTELAGWLFRSGEAMSAETAASLRCLREEGATQLVADLKAATRDVFRLNLAECTERLLDMGVELSPDLRSDVILPVAIGVILRRPELESGSWEDFIPSLEEPLGRVGHAILLRAILKTDPNVPEAWITAADEWVERQLEGLQHIDYDNLVEAENEDDLVEFFIQLRIVEAACREEAERQAPRRIGRLVAHDARLLPLLLRSISVWSGNLVSLRGRIRPPGEAIEAVTSHFESMAEVRAAIVAWRDSDTNNDPHQLVEELEGLVEEPGEV